MSISLGWNEIALRLVLTILAGVALGFNRSEHGKAAGLRTTLLVCVSASVAMIQVNLLLPLAGRAPDSFVMNDLMRLPLGILTGVGFIGGGAILRRNDIVLGVTTAATIWLATVVGLCIGGGQIGLGVAATLIGLLALGPLGSIEQRVPREQSALLMIELRSDGCDEQTIRRRLGEAGFSIAASRVTLAGTEGRRRFQFDLRSTRMPRDTTTPALIIALANEQGIDKVEWHVPDKAAE